MSTLDETKQSLDMFLELGSNIGTFVKFRSLLESLANRADDGDENAQEIIARVSQVARLITYANNKA